MDCVVELSDSGEDNCEDFIFFYRIRRYRLQLLPLHDMDGSDIDSEEDEEEREEENGSEREPVFTVSIESQIL